MAITLTQTDTAGTCVAGAWDGINPDASNSAKMATSGGTAGVTPVSLTSAATSAPDIYFSSIVGEPLNTSWASGTWTARIEITTANMNLGNGNFTVVRLNASCVSQEQLLTAQAFGGDWTTTGVKSGSGSGTAATALTTDLIGVEIRPVNNSGMSQVFGYKPSQNIDTPVVQGSAASGTRGAPFGQRSTAFNGGKTFQGILR